MRRDLRGREDDDRVPMAVDGMQVQAAPSKASIEKIVAPSTSTSTSTTTSANASSGAAASGSTSQGTARGGGAEGSAEASSPRSVSEPAPSHLDADPQEPHPPVTPLTPDSTQPMKAEASSECFLGTLPDPTEVLSRDRYPKVNPGTCPERPLPTGW